MIKPKQVKDRKVKARVTRGSGNVFSDLGFGSAEACELEVKAELTRQIYHRIKVMGLTQVQAAERMGIGQPDVSKLMSGKFVGYTDDRLISLLNLLEVDVDIVVRPRKTTAGHAPGIVRVREAAGTVNAQVATLIAPETATAAACETRRPR